MGGELLLLLLLLLLLRMVCGWSVVVIGLSILKLYNHKILTHSIYTQSRSSERGEKNNVMAKVYVVVVHMCCCCLFVVVVVVVVE